MKPLGIDFRKVVERNWFATRNFHCHWFEDADVLNGYLRFRTETLEDYLRHVRGPAHDGRKADVGDEVHAYIKREVMEPLAYRTPDCTLYWIDHNMEMRISAFFKSRDDWARIPAWGVDMPADPWKVEPVRLEHGYDEDKPAGDLGPEDMQSAARFRGGECLSREMTRGDLFTKLRWRCAFGHVFEAAPNTVLKGGHGCPACAPPGWNYDEEARRNPFFAQVWYPNHDREENHAYPADCWKDILGRE